MYDANLGRFLTRDPLPMNGQPDVLYDNNWFGDRLTAMRNLYAYANSSPVNRVDPSGLLCKPADPPMSMIPPEDELNPVGQWRPQPARGYPLSFGPVNRKIFNMVMCDGCKMDIEILARGYRYYRFSGGGFVGYDGRPIGVSNDPRDFFSAVVMTVCKTNIVCCDKNMPDVTERYVSAPLERRGLGVFIRQGAGDIETTLDKFQSNSPCDFAEDAITYLQANTQPGRI